MHLFLFVLVRVFSWLLLLSFLSSFARDGPAAGAGGAKVEDQDAVGADRRLVKLHRVRQDDALLGKPFGTQRKRNKLRV